MKNARILQCTLVVGLVGYGAILYADARGGYLFDRAACSVNGCPGAIEGVTPRLLGLLQEPGAYWILAAFLLPCLAMMCLLHTDVAKYVLLGVLCALTIFDFVPILADAKSASDVCAGVVLIHVAFGVLSLILSAFVGAVVASKSRDSDAAA